MSDPPSHGDRSEASELCAVCCVARVRAVFLVILGLLLECVFGYTKGPYAAESLHGLASVELLVRLTRLRRLNGRPQFIIHENSVEDSREYLNGTGVTAPFVFRTLEFRNHNDAWALRDVPERRELRLWLKEVLK